jgi:hypothetical protein
MSMYCHDQSGSSIIPNDHSGRNARAIVAAGPARRLVTIWGSNTLTLIVFVAGATSLASFAFHIGGQDQEFANADGTNSRVFIHMEVRRVWLPRALADLATHEAPPGAFLTHNDLARHLKLRGQEKVWYAVIVRGHDAEGGFVDIPIVRRPYNEPDLFRELLKILAIATGKPTDEPNNWLATASIGLVPDRLLERDPRDAVAELLNDSVAQLTRDFVGADAPHGPRFSDGE